MFTIHKYGQFVYSEHFKKKVRIHGQLHHDYFERGKRRWWVYLIQDTACNKAIIGSTVNPYKRWSSHKSSCNSKGECKQTGLSKHFTMRGGCPNDPGRRKETLNFTLLDYIHVTEEELGRVGHEPGAKCRCQACLRLKNVEDKWILKMGTFYGPWGLNERDEVQAKTRFTWMNN